MAKWGEGDPRWIVEERPDATNVNNWHWTEKNASLWSKDKLKELLLNLKVEDVKIGYCEITEITKCDGEASASNRKAKLFFFYEWNLELKWIGYANGSDKMIEGQIGVPNLSEENSMEDLAINVTLQANQPEGADLIKQMLRTQGTTIIQKKLQEYTDSLKREFSQGMILPTNKVSTMSISNKTKSVSAVANKDKKRESTAAATPGVKLKLGSITMTETMKCEAIDFYNALTTKEMVQAFTRGSCVLEPQVGGKFQMFDNNISGTFVELVPGEKIVQKWRRKQWPTGHYSTVKMIISQQSDCTKVTVDQTEVPSSEIDNTKEGWNIFYWESLKRTFGFGAQLV